MAEGIRGASEETAAIMTMHRRSTRGRGSSLVVQDIDHHSLGPPVINPDMAGTDFDRALRENVSLPDRLLMRACMPVVGLLSRFVGPQTLMKPYLAVDDLPTAEQEIEAEAMESFDKVVVDDRDALVCKALGDIYKQHGTDAMEVAVVYGAAHIPGIFRFLSRRYRYRVVSAEWLTVFAF